MVGGILGPVWHLAHHRNDHTHEADGRTTPFDLGDDEEPALGHTHEAEEPAETHAHPHPHPHAHGHAGAHADLAHTPAEVHEPAAPARPSEAHHAAAPLPAPLDHGHASLAHFGLALLGAPVLLPLPAPEPGEWISAATRTATLRLFHPSFPLPRPPPVRIV